MKKSVLIHNRSAVIDACMEELKDKVKGVKVKGKDENLEEMKKTEVVAYLSSCEGLKKTL